MKYKKSLRSKLIQRHRQFKRVHVTGGTAGGKNKTEIAENKAVHQNINL